MSVLLLTKKKEKKEKQKKKRHFSLTFYSVCLIQQFHTVYEYDSCNFLFLIFFSLFSGPFPSFPAACESWYRNQITGFVCSQMLSDSWCSFQLVLTTAVTENLSVCMYVYTCIIVQPCAFVHGQCQFPTDQFVPSSESQGEIFFRDRNATSVLILSVDENRQGL